MTRAPASEPVHVVIDVAGPKVHGAGEWLVERHSTQTRRSRRKLHLAVDPGTGEILASGFTTNEADNASQVRPLLEQITGPIASVTADGAYDGEPVYRTAALARGAEHGRRHGTQPAGPAHPDDPGQGTHGLAENGQLRPALAPGNRKSRHRVIIGRGLRARSLPAQKTETKVACSVLNRMTSISIPVSQRIARRRPNLPPHAIT